MRCLLKLAGTPYLPDFSGKILILEGNSGGADKMTACLSQLSQMGVFEQINGILLGTFTEMERRGDGRRARELVRSFAGPLPIAVTEEIGHGSGARCAVIGGRLSFKSRKKRTRKKEKRQFFCDFGGTKKLSFF
ncbi:MAG: hypothetical protein ACLUD8_11400 [Clostridium sp.]